MAVGDLSSAQRRYRDIIARGTGLHRDVVTAWIGAESGWNVTKPGHNYLNVGPGRTYPTVDHAAGDVVRIVSSLGYYRGIRDAIRSGNPDRQVKAITTSPWDAGRYGGDGSRLINVYNQIAGADVATSSSAAGAEVVQTDSRDLARGAVRSIPGLGPLLAPLIPGEGQSLQESIVQGAAKITIGFAFTAAALALIVVGLLRLLNVDPRDLMPGRA